MRERRASSMLASAAGGSRADVTDVCDRSPTHRGHNAHDDQVRAHDCVVRRTNNLALCLRERKRHGRARVTTVDCHLDALHADQPLDPGDDRWSVLHDERVLVVVIAVISIGIVLRLLGDAVEPRELDRPMPLRNLAGDAVGLRGELLRGLERALEERSMCPPVVVVARAARGSPVAATPGRFCAPVPCCEMGRSTYGEKRCALRDVRCVLWEAVAEWWCSFFLSIFFK